MDEQHVLRADVERVPAEAVAAGVPISGELELWVADVGDVARDAVAPPACAALGVAAPVDGEVIFCVVLRDAAGHRFMPDEHPDAELAPRDVVARAVWRHRRATGAVVLDA
ncbi:MAG: FAD-binding protein, partial [Microthrixaceae bacterium]|nr:FAD-binding protein [Microthrixaceae bacterium]